MNSFLTVLISCGIILSFPASFILAFFRNKVNQEANRWLALTLFCIMFYTVNYFLFLTKSILYIPVYYKLTEPFCYLIPPCIYFYIHNLLNGPAPRPRYFWWHFLPAALMAIDILPWLGMSGQERYNIVSSIVTNHSSVLKAQSGFLPTWVHFILKPVQGILYLGYLIMYLQIAEETNKLQAPSTQYKIFYQWATVLTVIEGIVYLCLASYTAVLFINIENKAFILKATYLPGILTSVSFILSALYLYLHPSLLYGDPAIEQEPVRDTRDEIMEISPLFSGVAPVYGQGTNTPPPKTAFPILSDEALLVYQHHLETELIDNTLFKQQGLTVQQLAKYCKIPTRAFSVLLNTVYHQHFNDFINEYRIRYVVDRLRRDNWKELTLEGLAYEAGFSSRTTFFLAFKKKIGVSPTLYLQNQNKEKMIHSRVFKK